MNSPYSVIDKIENRTDAANYFLKTLLPTNRQWQFYVDWEKVVKLVENFKVELGILESVLDSPEEEFQKTVKKYPEVTKLFPRLLAVAKGNEKISVLIDPVSREQIDYNFSELPKSDDDFNKFFLFWSQSGLRENLKHVKRLRDYYLGLEVGTDTNARKNRGGTEWESFIEPLILEIAKKNGYEVRIRKKFEKVLADFGIEAPKELHRNIDFLVFKGKNFVDIEANFFTGSGTKLEVPGAYVNRDFKIGFNLSFILFSDGLGWNTAKDRVKEYFEKFPCVVNYNMAKQGVLEQALKNILG